MLGTPLALAFTAGMVATFNPCGFSLLPAYVSAFVAADTHSDRIDRRIGRAIGVAAAMSVGFVVVFAAAGIVIDALADQVRRQLPWITIAIGALLTAAGIAMVAGWKPIVSIPMLNLKRRGATLGAMVLYGATFAVASLSCTIGPFLAVTGTALTQSPAEGVATYVAYGLGMGFVILAISLATALAHSAVVNRMRSLSAAVVRVGGALMILAGLYIMWYARWELAVFGGDPETDPLIDAAESVRLWFVDLIESIGAQRLAAIIGIVVVVGLWLARFRGRPPTDDPAREVGAGRPV